MSRLVRGANRLASGSNGRTAGGVADALLQGLCRTTAKLFGVPIALVRVLEPARFGFAATTDGTVVAFGWPGLVWDCGLPGWNSDALVIGDTHLDERLADAIRQGGFVLHYQPIVNLASGEVGGVEALLRWQHPTRGTISPAEFIPVAEETGLIVAIGEWALQEACREAAAWPSALRVAVNVSAVQFQRPGLEQSVVRALAASDLPAERLELEITETVLMQDVEAAGVCLHRLRSLGVRIALDDFGTGHSSLSYLRRFPFDKIKIDRSFIKEIADPDTASIVRAIVGIGERLGTSITAEGVETREQLACVQHEGCTEVQGFFYSRPIPAASALTFVQSHLSAALASDDGGASAAAVLRRRRHGAQGRAAWAHGRSESKCRS